MRRKWSAYEKRLVACRQEWRCAHCALLLDAAYEIDHIVALENDGPDCFETNAHALCRRCHGEKTLRDNLVALQRRRTPVAAQAPSPFANAWRQQRPRQATDADVDAADDPFRCYRYTVS